MSLINQALRKAQNDRTPGHRPPASANPTGAGSSMAPPSRSGMSPGLVVGLIVVVALLIGVIAGLSVVLLKDKPAPTEITAQPALAPLEPTATPAPAPAPTAPTPTVEAREAVFTPPTTPEPAATQATAPDEQTVLEQLRMAREAAEAKAAKAEAARVAAEAEAARKAAIQPSQDIITWLSHTQISGVRLSDTGSKVILNGKAYAVGETANFELGLKVLVIQEKRVLFIDGNGKKYLKRL
ncbi:MAG: hypothetical protein ACSHX8_12620 [Opitutaceae bacterium]